MTADPFTDRLARVRDRFATSLAGKIDETSAAIPRLSAAAPEAFAALEEAYSYIHGMVGVGRAVGFPATGQAAHDVEDVLRAARLEGRGLTAEEIAKFTETMQALRDVAARELQSFQSIQQ
jgi:chemotaxis protein histidine kinase CheA